MFDLAELGRSFFPPTQCHRTAIAALTAVSGQPGQPAEYGALADEDYYRLIPQHTRTTAHENHGTREPDVQGNGKRPGSARAQ